MGLNPTKKDQGLIPTLKKEFMIEEEKVALDTTQNPEESKTLNDDVSFKEDELFNLEESVSKRVKTAVFQKNHFKAKAQKIQNEFDEYKTKFGKPDDAGQTKKEEVPLAGETDRFELIELKQDFPNVSREDLLKAQKLAKAEGVKTDELIRGDYFQAYLEKKSSKTTAEGAMPIPSNRTGQRDLDFTSIVKNPKLYKSLPIEKRAEFDTWQKANYPDA